MSDADPETEARLRALEKNSHPPVDVARREEVADLEKRVRFLEEALGSIT